MQRYYKKTKSKQKSQRFYPLYPKIIIYEYSFFAQKILNVQKQQISIQMTGKNEQIRGF